MRPTASSDIYCGLDEFADTYHITAVKNLDKHCSDFAPKEAASRSCGSCAHLVRPSDRAFSEIEHCAVTLHEGPALIQRIRTTLESRAPLEYESCVNGRGVLTLQPGFLPWCRAWSDDTGAEALSRFVVGPVVNVGNDCDRWEKRTAAQAPQTDELDRLKATWEDQKRRAEDTSLWRSLPQRSMGSNDAFVKNLEQLFDGGGIAEGRLFWQEALEWSSRWSALELISYCLRLLGADPGFISMIGESVSVENPPLRTTDEEMTRRVVEAVQREPDAARMILPGLAAMRGADLVAMVAAAPSAINPGAAAGTSDAVRWKEHTDPARETEYRQAAEQGDPYGACRLGEVLMGRGEFDEAERWLQQAVERGLHATSSRAGADLTSIKLQRAATSASFAPTQAPSEESDEAASYVRRVAADALSILHPTPWNRLGAGPAGMLTEAERIARSITDKGLKAWALLSVAKALAATDPDRAERLAHSLSGWQKVSALTSVAKALAATDPDRAERIARSITSSVSKADALREVAEALATTVPDRAERIARSITEDSEDFLQIGVAEAQAWALTGVAKTLAATDADRAIGLLTDAERMARSTSESAEATALSGIAEALAAIDPDHAARLFTEAERIARSTTDGEFSMAWALLDIAKALAATDPDRAERIARSITDEDSNVRALSGVARALAPTDPGRAAGLLTDAESIARSITDENSKQGALSGIVLALAATST